LHVRVFVLDSAGAVGGCRWHG